jgi:hypothetical protein
MRVLDLFSGLNGWGDPWRERGHDVIGIDFDRKLPATIHADLLTYDLQLLPWRPDVILASPPCEGFSVMNIGKNWHGPGCLGDEGHVDMAPKTPAARLALELVQRTRAIIAEMEPRYFVIENPRDKLRVLPVMAGLDRVTVWYCRYGEERAKPTDLWGGFPPSWRPEPECRNGGSDHVSAPRGSQTGTQSTKSYHEKGVIPRLLSRSLAEAAERDYAVGAGPEPMHVNAPASGPVLWPDL